MKKTICLLLTVTLLLVGCATSEPERIEETMPTQDSSVNETEAPNLEPLPTGDALIREQYYGISFEVPEASGYEIYDEDMGASFHYVPGTEFVTITSVDVSEISDSATALYYDLAVETHFAGFETTDISKNDVVLSDGTKAKSASCTTSINDTPLYAMLVAFMDKSRVYNVAYYKVLGTDKNHLSELNDFLDSIIVEDPVE